MSKEELVTAETSKLLNEGHILSGFRLYYLLLEQWCISVEFEGSPHTQHVIEVCWYRSAAHWSCRENDILLLLLMRILAKGIWTELGIVCCCIRFLNVVKQLLKLLVLLLDKEGVGLRASEGGPRVNLLMDCRAECLIFVIHCEIRLRLGEVLNLTWN